jgi:hypothetical protein
LAQPHSLRIHKILQIQGVNGFQVRFPPQPFALERQLKGFHWKVGVPTANAVDWRHDIDKESRKCSGPERS